MPSTATDRLNGLTTSVAVKPPCLVATTANITLSGLQTINGVALAEDDRVLVKDQTTQSQNGIYLASSGDWTRAKDFDGNRDVVQGTRVLVAMPNSAHAAEYEVTTANPITIDTTSITFVLRYGANATYDRTTAEIAAGVTPTDYSINEGHVNRYQTNTTPGTTDMQPGFRSAYLVCAQSTAKTNWVTVNPNEIYGIGATVECDSTRPVNWNFNMLTPEGGVGGYIKPLATLSNGIIRYRNAGRNASGGIIYRPAFYDPTSGGRNYSVLGALVLDDFGNGRVIEPWIGYIKGHGIRTDNWVFGDIVRPTIRLCGDTSKPALQLGIAGSAYQTQSVTVECEKSEVNYSTYYTHVTTGAQDIKINGTQYEADTAVAATNNAFLVVDISSCHVSNIGFNRNTGTQFIANASCTFSNLQFDSDNADGSPKAKFLSAVMGSGLKAVGGGTNTGYDFQFGSAGSGSNAVVSNIVLAGAGIVCYGGERLTNVRLVGSYNYGAISGKYALMLGESGGSPAEAYNVKIESPGANNHGINLPVAKARCIGLRIESTSGTGVGVTMAADTDIDQVTFSSVTNKFSNANTDPESCRINGYSGYDKAGVATITNPATTVVVTHGAEFTPLLKQIHVTPGGSHTWWISNITSTQFTINVSTTPGSSTDFGWRVKY